MNVNGNISYSWPRKRIVFSLRRNHEFISLLFVQILSVCISIYCIKGKPCKLSLDVRRVAWPGEESTFARKRPWNGRRTRTKCLPWRLLRKARRAPRRSALPLSRAPHIPHFPSFLSRNESPAHIGKALLWAFQFYWKF